jgi:glycosyltransferase involved in cell wall biosynthesis
MGRRVDETHGWSTMSTERSAHIVYVDHTSELGGAELGLLRAATQTALPVRTILLADGPLAARLREAGAPVRVLAPGSPPSVLRRLRAAIRAEAPVLVVTNSLRATVMVALAAPRGTRLAAYVQDDVSPGGLSRSKRMLTALVLRRYAHVLANSAFTAETLDSLRLRTPSHVIYTVSGTPLRAFDVPRDDIGASAPLRVVFAGRMVSWKGPDLVLDAVDRVAARIGPDAIELVMCGAPLMGTPEFYERLVARAARMAPRVSFVGFVDVAPYLAAADVLVHASTRPEPFGQVIVQAAAAGVCVVAPDDGGPAEILGGVAEDLTYPTGDVAALAERLVELARDRARLASLAARTRAAARAFADEPMIALHDRVLAGLVTASA